MSGMLSRSILRALYRANFEKIITYILDICDLIVEDYEKKQLKLPNDENKIRSIMLEEYMNKYKDVHGMSGYKFEPEVPENYVGGGQHIGRVDIRILLKSDFEKDDAYYIVECKRIDGSSDLNKKYVKEGVARFVTEKYSSYYGRNIMLAFVVKKIDISANAKLIEGIQNADSNEHMYGDFELVNSGRVTENYKCLYQIQSGKVELRHIFSDYSSII
ncbi:hypothetical protein [Eubacterium oxidoreducens]|uniref:Uncharacterized protein n=1 Tax=Eubacterium oxidoreducens TaxID=1732 RepID=A0A1G6BY10_EUBOX|nr:hypothetical protein [Eubacterium oxidoreducens]SDB25467.1 hypothetical protein SAMN02910417_01897 [Eubacterium oxidoreducens]